MNHRPLTALTLLLLAACQEPLDTTRPPRPELTLGGEIYQALCQRIAHQDNPLDISGDTYRGTCAAGEEPHPSASPRLRALHAERSRFISAVDQWVPAPLAPNLGELLQTMGPLYDAQQVQGTTRALGELLAGIEDSPEALASLERFSAREGYRPLRLASGVIRPVFTYPELAPLIDHLLAMSTEGGAAHPELQQLFTALYHRLGKAQPQASAEPTALELTEQLLLSPDPHFSDGTPRLLARRDPRGVAQLNPLSDPFVDADGDGLADLNQRGQYVDEEGRPLRPGAPFRRPGESSSLRRDARGRLMDRGGQLVYGYVDASETLLGALMSEMAPVVKRNPGMFIDLLLPARGLVGRDVSRHSVGLDTQVWSYQSFEAGGSPLLDLMHGLGTVAKRPLVLDVLEGVERLALQHEGTVAEVVSLADQISTWADDPSLAQAGMAEGNLFADDMVLLLTEIARVPGLLEDVVIALRHPHTQHLGRYFADFLRHNDRVNYDPNDINGPPLGKPITPVDRTAPDTKLNRSIFHRFLHLVHDTNGARMCNKAGAKISLDLGFFTINYPIIGSYDACELFEVENMVVFYQEAILGEADLNLDAGLINFVIDMVDNIGLLDDALEWQSGIKGFSRSPTPQAVNRMIFAPRNNFLRSLIDPPLTFDGALIEKRHEATIFAWEAQGATPGAPSFYQSITPLMRAFHQHGRLNLFSNLMSLIHLHYASPHNDTTQSEDPLATAFSNQSNMVSWEPLIANILDPAQGDALGKLAQVAEALYWMDLQSGRWGEQVLAEALRDLLLPERSPNLTLRDGSTHVLKSDGVSRVEPLAPWWVIGHAATKLGEALEGYPRERASLRQAGQQLADQLLEIEETPEGKRFADRRLPAAVSVLAPFLAQRIEAHQQGEGLAAWTASWIPELQRRLEGPLFSSLLRFAHAVASDGEARQQADAMLAYLLTAPGPGEAFEHTLVGAADVLQLLRDDTNLAPVMRAVAPALEPTDGLAVRTLDLLHALRPRDVHNVLPALLPNLVQEREGGDGETVLEALIDVFVQVNRRHPGSAEPLTAEDYALVLGTLRHALTDPASGLERLYSIIENR